jgi:HSP20 family molecular chaperone IbpA
MTTRVKEDATQEMTPHQKQELTGAETTRPGHVFTPVVDIFETEAAIVVLADMPGVKADAVTIDLNENVLSLDGRVSEVHDPDEQILLREYHVGSFHREFRLSNLIDQSRIDATMQDGVLRLTLPKAEAARPRQIEVRTG